MNKKIITCLLLGICVFNGFNTDSGTASVVVSTDGITYKIKKKDKRIKVTFKANEKATTSEPIVLQAAHVNQAFAEVEQKYGPKAKVKVKVKNKGSDKKNNKKKDKNRIESVVSGAFSGHSSLVEVDFDSIPLIQTHAIQNCSSLAELEFGGSGIRIEKDVILNCPALEEIEFGSSNISIEDDAFKGTFVRRINIGGSVAVGDQAFAQCPNLSQVNIGGAGVAVGDLAFAQCPNLSRVNIGGAGVAVGAQAFAQCSKLTAVSIGGAGIAIGESAFKDCLSLRTVDIGGADIKVDPTAFDGCPTSAPNSVDLGKGSLGEVKKSRSLTESC